jgi:hypothetical protein
MTASQIVDRFGRTNPNRYDDIDWSRISISTRQLFERHQMNQWVEVIHIIRPNPDYKPRSPLAKHFRYESVYYEPNSAKDNMLLNESGFEYFPVLVPRWRVIGSDVWGSMHPASIAIGDIMALQTMQRRKAEAVEKMVRPPVNASNEMRNQGVSMLPGAVNWTPDRQGQGIRPVYEVQPRIQELILDIQESQMRVKKAYYSDLFLAITNSDRRQITATEIEERREEKLLALGPVLQRLNQDLLDPLVDITFYVMNKRGLLPDPPEELQGQDLAVEYISVMAQAQKLAGISTIERFSQIAFNVIRANPETADKVDMDQLIDEYAKRLSLPPGIVRSDERVEEIRANRAEQQRQQQMQQAMQQMTQGAKDLSQSNLEGDNALNRLLQQSGAGNLLNA